MATINQSSTVHAYLGNPRDADAIAICGRLVVCNCAAGVACARPTGGALARWDTVGDSDAVLWVGVRGMWGG